MTRYFVRAPRAEVRTVIRDDQGFAREHAELAPHSATSLGFDGKTLKANKQGLFEVTQEEHDRLVGQHGFESAGTADDEHAKDPADPDEGKVESDPPKAHSKPRRRAKAKA